MKGDPSNRPAYCHDCERELTLDEIERNRPWLCDDCAAKRVGDGDG